jgi:putative FmdB family regulatory protein
MPLYSYHCANCDKDAELLVSSGRPPVCPSCGNQKMERLIARVAPAGKSGAIKQAARAQAAREGHLSNFSRTGRKS